MDVNDSHGYILDLLSLMILYGVMCAAGPVFRVFVPACEQPLGLETGSRLCGSQGRFNRHEDFASHKLGDASIIFYVLLQTYIRVVCWIGPSSPCT